MKYTEKKLKNFSYKMAKEFEAGKIKHAIHFSGGNEKQLIRIFQRIKKDDYVLSTWRSHFHYLLKGGSQKKLADMIRNGQSMSVFDKELNFLASSIVAGITPIATGLGWALKQQGSNANVWCFVGDGATDEGAFWEAARYVEAWKLPVTFIIENNQLSVETPYNERWSNQKPKYPSCCEEYFYVREFPHCNTGKIVKFL